MLKKLVAAMAAGLDAGAGFGATCWASTATAVTDNASAPASPSVLIRSVVTCLMCNLSVILAARLNDPRRPVKRRISLGGTVPAINDGFAISLERPLAYRPKPWHSASPVRHWPGRQVAKNRRTVLGTVLAGEIT
jgi:hypothetical protein